MKKQFIFLCSITLAVCFTIACRKDQTHTNQSNPAADLTKLNKLFNSQAPQRETFTMNTESAKTITTQRGTTFEIPAFAFANAQNQVVSGQVTIIVQEAHKPSEMLFANKPTLTQKGEILSSFGEFFIGAEQNGQPLSLTSGKAIEASRPFVSKFGAKQSDVLNWTGDVSDKGKGVEWSLMHSSANLSLRNESLRMTIQALQWHNWDQISQFATNNGSTTLSVSFVNNFNLETEFGSGREGFMLSGAYFRPNASNSLFKLYEPIQNGRNGVGVYSYGPIVPVGLEGKLLSYSIIDGRFYIQLQEVTIPSNGFLITNPVEVDESEFLQIIQGLN